MALKACRKFSGVIPRLLFKRNGPPFPCASKGMPSDMPETQTRCAYVLWTKRAYLLRSFSSSSSPSETNVSYDQLKQILASQSSVVIDVREPWELREYGHMPGSINVPLGQVCVALQLDPEEFRERFGGDMPQQTDHIIFSCLAGIRSMKALDTAVSLGYTDVRHYPGGWQEWAELEQLN
ncbi:thiosulfate sulfurtransferase/rhodanese-like domain-containing protein 3 [Osmerus eperlanus]|uniref:thiosulfate sulfurtransferase/rhodanese-like domain-containing protein 3 n=1 Tax=Osmerus eperlanus TaxID=29151 RepID=UPI002E0FF5B6